MMKLDRIFKEFFLNIDVSSIGEQTLILLSGMTQ